MANQKLKVLNYQLVAGFLGLISLGFGCGQDSHDKGNDFAPEIPNVTISRLRPRTYQLVDQDCQNSSASISLERTTISEWNDDSIASSPVALAKTRSDVSLTGPGVMETNRALFFSRQCAWEGDAHICRDGAGQAQKWTSTTEPKTVRVCRDSFQYPRDSYEGAALTSLYFIGQAHDRFIEVAKTSKALPDISLQMFPEFKTTYTSFHDDAGRVANLSIWMVRNLAYFPVQGSLTTPMIAVFPEPDAADPMWAGGLWESGFVLAHEYGHHIEAAGIQNFQTTSSALGMESGLSAKISGVSGLQWNPLRHAYDDLHSLSGVSAYANWSTAVSEGFADMVGYYTKDGSMTSLRGMPCFSKNRDLDSRVFANNDAKILTTEIVQGLLGAANPNTFRNSFSAFDMGLATTDCGQPNLEDPHSVGAIIAFGINQLFTTAVDSAELQAVTTDARVRNNLRYRLTLEWLRVLRSKSGESATVAKNLEEGGGNKRLTTEALVQPMSTAAAEAIDTILYQQPGFSLAGANLDGYQQKLCKQFSEMFPAVRTPAFGKQNGECL